MQASELIAYYRKIIGMNLERKKNLENLNYRQKMCVGCGAASPASR